MKKIPTLFARNHATDRRVRNEVTPGCEWVLSGQGKATEKFDGTCCLVRGGKLYKRREVRDADLVAVGAPEGFEIEDHDPVTLKSVGWVPVGEGPEDRWHREGFSQPGIADGTYELIGPKVQGNPYRLEMHLKRRHGLEVIEDCPRDFDGIRGYLQARNIEGVVFHHEDGRMAKIKRRDFGLPWPG